VIAAVEDAGRLLSEEFVRPGGPRGTGSHADVDHEIEEKLREQLLRLFPARWLGEETGALVGQGGNWCWLVDPHDGTSAFLAGERGSAVSVALLHDGVPVLGVVHAPLPPDREADTIAWADGSDCLLRNGVSIAPLPVDRDLSTGSIVYVSQSAATRPVGNALAVAPARFVALPSIAYRLARVACGDGVAAVSLNGPCGWDYAGGHAILCGAGLVLLDEAGHKVKYTVDGHSSTAWCFGGSAKAAEALAKRDWRSVRGGRRMPPRVALDPTHPVDQVALDRAVGCLFGQVAGDSLGSLVEFRSPQDIRRQYPDGVRDLQDGGTWETIAGQPTDDSELALDLARTLVAQASWSSEAVAGAYAGWYASHPFDIGSTTRQALSAAARAKEDKARAAQTAASRESQSNGALMRCSPIGIWAHDAAEAAVAAREDAALTHPHPICKAASAAFVAAILTAISGGDRAMMLAAAEAVIPEAAAEPLREALARARRRGPAGLHATAGLGPDWVPECIPPSCPRDAARGRGH
jgi:fructose-1,6-bisphosphatase/inositol monophosphatase family enzyme